MDLRVEDPSVSMQTKDKTNLFSRVVSNVHSIESSIEIMEPC